MKRTKPPVKQSHAYNLQEEDYALEIFSSDSYLTINKNLLKQYGPNTAIFLSNLIDKYKHLSKQSLINDSWFFLTHEKQIENTGLTIHEIRTCKAKLIEDEILEVKTAGQPSKQWYRLRLKNLLKLIPSMARGRIFQPLGVEFSEGIYINEPINNKPIDKKDETLMTNVTSIEIDSRFKEPLLSWLKYKRSIGSSYKSTNGVVAAYKRLVRFSNNDPKVAYQVIEQSIGNNWAGLFELKETKGKNINTIGSRRFGTKVEYKKKPITKY